MSGRFRLGPPPERLVIGASLVRTLIAEQFPGWAGLAVRPVERPGWDNFTFRLGDGLLVRLPSAAPYALAVAKERTGCRGWPRRCRSRSRSRSRPGVRGRATRSRGRSTAGYQAGP